MHNQGMIMTDEISTHQTGGFGQFMARAIFRAISWDYQLTLPENPKFMVIGAPHTSNMDFVFMLLLKFATGLKLHWIGKHTIFKPPFGGLMRRLGGIPVDRRTSSNMVDSIVGVIKQQDKYIVAIAPEGTRSKSKYWRTGFYYIALGAEIPIALGFIDYKKKVVGIGPSFYPTGDINSDFAGIQEFYAGITGKYPHKQGPLQLRPSEEKS